MIKKGEIFGKYRLIELIARGGMAEVYKAKSYGVKGFEKLLVIKRILSHLSDNTKFVEMFISEAKISVSLSHTNIVQVFDLGEVDGVYYIAMEYVHGYDLAEVINLVQTHKLNFPYEICVYIASEIAKGLDYAHRCRDANMQPLEIIHRDISPHNILLSFEGDVKITDFGIAKAKLVLEKTVADVIKGKYAYMAPEQITGEKISRQVDIFSLGVIIYEMLALKRPFDHPSTYELLRKIREGEREDIKSINPQIPDELVKIVNKAMARNQKERYQTANELYEDLISYLYFAGYKVGSRNLADFLLEIQAVGKAERKENGREEYLFKNLYEVSEGADVEVVSKQEITPVEIPTGISKKASITPSPSVTPSQVREVSILKISIENFAEAEEFAPEFERIISQYEGSKMQEDTAIFGLKGNSYIESALKCALDLHQIWFALDRRSKLSISVHKGEVKIFEDGTLEEEINLKKILNVSSRLLEQAEGRIFLSSEVYEEAKALFQIIEAGSMIIEEAELIPVYELKGKGLLKEKRTPFIGRRNEFNFIGEKLNRASKRSKTIIGIKGQKGIGRTRFVHELKERLEQRSYKIGWHEAILIPRYREVSFQGIKSMIQAILGIDEDDPKPVVQTKFRRLRELGLGFEEINSLRVMFDPQSEQTLESQDKKRKLRSSIFKIITKLAEEKFTILVWDDIDYMDEDSLAILTGLFKMPRWSAFMILVIFEAGFVHPWNIIEGYSEIEIGPLLSSEIKQLVSSKLKVKDIPWDFLDMLEIRTGGNPFYIEEYIKALLEAKAIKIKDESMLDWDRTKEKEVPQSLQELVSSKIERLDLYEKEFAEAASVIGTRFNLELLKEVLKIEASKLTNTLTRLEVYGILKKIALNEYVFKHTLIREVLLEQIEFSKREKLSMEIASAIEKVFKHRLEEFYGLLAIHYREGGDYEKAIKYLRLDAQRLKKEASYEAALKQYLRTIDLLKSISSLDFSLILDLYLEVGELALAIEAIKLGIEKMKLAFDIAKRIKEEEKMAFILSKLAIFYSKAGNFSEAKRYVGQALKITRKVKTPLVQADILANIARMYSSNGEPRIASKYYLEAITLCKKHKKWDKAAAHLISLALCMAMEGEYEKAERYFNTAEKWKPTKDPRFMGELCNLRALFYSFAARFEEAVTIARKGLTIVRESGLRYLEMIISHNIGEANLRLSNYKDAFISLKDSLEIASELGHKKLEMLNLAFLGFIDSAKFHRKEGLYHLEEALKYSEQEGHKWDIVQLKYYLGLLWYLWKDKDTAKRYLMECLSLGRALNFKLYIDDCLSILSKLKE
jgi:serine/threonine protein kinase/predicted ATPase